MSSEKWAALPGYGSHYEVSDLGRVRSKDRFIIKNHPMTKTQSKFFYKGKILKPTLDSGYYRVHLGVDKKKYLLNVHRAVLLAFVGNPPEGTEGCHNNGVSTDNRLENLRWDTHLSNNKDRIIHNTYARGEDHAMAVINEETVKQIRAGLISKKDSGVGNTQFWRVKTKKSWTHIQDELGVK